MATTARQRLRFADVQLLQDREMYASAARVAPPGKCEGATAWSDPCSTGGLVVARMTFGCVHEHLVDVDCCTVCWSTLAEHDAGDGALLCLVCLWADVTERPAGALRAQPHKCRMHLLRTFVAMDIASSTPREPLDGPGDTITTA